MLGEHISKSSISNIRVGFVLILVTTVLSGCKDTMPSMRDGLIVDEDKLPISPMLSGFLEAEGYVTLELTDKEGNVKIAGADGIQIEPCGHIEGTRMPDQCKLNKIDLFHVNEIVILGTNGLSPSCTTKQIGRYLIQYPSHGSFQGDCAPNALRSDISDSSQTVTASSPSSSANKQPKPSNTEPNPSEPSGELILDEKKIPVSSKDLPTDLSRFMKKMGYLTLTLTNTRGQVKIANSDGLQIDPCGNKNGTKITGTCNLNGVSLITENRITILTWTPSEGEIGADQSGASQNQAGALMRVSSTSSCRCGKYRNVSTGADTYKSYHSGGLNNNKCNCTSSHTGNQCAPATFTKLQTVSNTFCSDLSGAAFIVGNQVIKVPKIR